MAFVSTSRRSGFSFGTTQLMTLATNLSLFAERIALSYRQHKTFSQLSALDKHQLADVGLNKADLHEMIEVGHDQAIWRLSLARKRASQR